MNNIKNTILISLAFIILSSISIKKETFSLTVEVSDLRNSKGTILFALYNRKDAFPDEHYQKYFKKLTGKIINGNSIITFKNIPEGKYAINILHDENNDGKIDKGFIFPTEGIGFSNFKSLGFANKPNFEKASFNVITDKTLKIKIIYF